MLEKIASNCSHVANFAFASFIEIKSFKAFQRKLA